MSDPATITVLISATMIGDTEGIKEAQRKLEELYQDPNFMHNLLLIPKESSLPYNVQKAAVVYTIVYARHCVINKQQPRINQMSEYLLNYLAENSIDLSLRRHLAGTLQYILTKDREFVIRNMLTAHYIQMLKQAHEQNDGNINFQFLGLIAQILIGSADNISKELFSFIRESFGILINFNLRLFKYAVEILQKNETRQETIQCLKIIKIYSSVFKLYMKKIIYSDMQTVKLLYEESLSELLSVAFNIIIPNNDINTTIVYFKVNQDHEVVEQLHAIKADYVSGLSALMRTLLQNFKEPKMLSANSIIQSPVLLPSFINSLVELLSKLPYNHIKSPSLIKLIEEILNVLIICVRNNFFYKIFSEYKESLIYGCIFRILKFTDVDYENLFFEPDEFINEILQIIEMDPAEFMQSRKRENLVEDDVAVDEEVESYSTLRTVGATLLQSYCLHIDGSLAEILNYVISVLKEKVESNFEKSLLLMLIGILGRPAEKREGLVEEIVGTITLLLRNRKLPQQLKEPEDANRQTKEENIQYLMLLLTLYKYLPKYKGSQEAQILSTIFSLICQLLNRKQSPEAIKFISYDLITILCNLKTADQSIVINFGLKFVQLLNILINTPYRNLEKVLETLFDIFKNDNICSEMMKHNQAIVTGTVDNMVQIIYKEVEKGNLTNQLFINKSWNVITDISENDIFIPALIPQIQQSIMPLLPFIDEKFQLDYEENIFMLMSSFIKKAKAVTNNQLLMFQIIPRLFYSLYDKTFVHSYETLQIFIFYGSNILAGAPQAMEMIIKMSITSMETTQGRNRKRNEEQNCEGVLLLQSLILSCGNSFTFEMWVQVTKALTRRLDTPQVKGNVLKSNIFATILLIVMIGNKFFQPDENDLLLNRVLQNYNCFTVKYSIKVAIVSLSQIICQYNQPYVQNRFAYLLDTILCLLEAHQVNNDLFQKDSISDGEKDYDTYLDTLVNSMKELNEVEHVKNKMMFLKENFSAALQEAVGQLPNKRKQFLNQLMSVSKINNSTRKIFRVKKE